MGDGPEGQGRDLGGFAKRQGLVVGKDSRQRGCQGWVRHGYPSPKMACTLSEVPNSNVFQINHGYLSLPDRSL